MNIVIDEDLKAVAAYMQANVPASKLVAVAGSLNAIAPLFWGHYRRDEITPLVMRADDLHRRLSASE